jgi:hypothetical protein
MTTTSVTLLTDWYSFALTDRARSLSFLCIWDKGLSIIERDMMKNENLYYLNQGAVFCRARVSGGLLLVDPWPRVGDYVDRAFSTMIEILDRYIMDDGGVSEGIGYFCQTCQGVLPAIIAYARSKGKNPKQFLPKNLLWSRSYVSAMSGTTPGTAMTLGDGRTDLFCGDIVPIMAAFFAGSEYDKIHKACLDEKSIFAVTGTLSGSGGIVGFAYGPDRIIESECIAPHFMILRKTGQMCSFRKKDSRSVRIHLSGTSRYPQHSHGDIGSFILEIDGAPVLVDRGMVEYHLADSALLKSS